MRTVSHDMGTPDVRTMGLGWPLMPFGRTTVLSISGASPGGVAALADRTMRWMAQRARASPNDARSPVWDRLAEIARAAAAGSR